MADSSDGAPVGGNAVLLTGDGEVSSLRGLEDSGIQGTRGSLCQKEAARGSLEIVPDLGTKSKPGFGSTQTMNFQVFKLDLEKAEE